MLGRSLRVHQLFLQINKRYGIIWESIKDNLWQSVRLLQTKILLNHTPSQPDRAWENILNMQVQVETKQGSVIVAKASKKTTKPAEVKETPVQGKVFGYVVGRPANQQEHPDNKK